MNNIRFVVMEKKELKWKYTHYKCPSKNHQ